MSSRRGDDRVHRLGLLSHVAGVGCVLAAAGAVWGLVCLPLQAGNVETRNQLDAALRLVHESREIRKAFEETRAEYDRTGRELVELRRRIPASAAESDFLKQTAELASREGVSILEFHPGRTSQGELCHQMDVRLKARGGYAGVCRFLSGLNELTRLCRTKSVKVSADGATEGLYHLELSLEIFFGLEARAEAVTLEPKR
jgi:Tfp pilus assembly protein PilO